MQRPCFLIIDREHPGNISTRKLVVESAKMNVITAYSAEEGVATLERFPRVDGVIVDTVLFGMSCADLVSGLRAIVPEIMIIAIQGARHVQCPGANHELDSFDPARLLLLLQSLKPAETAAIEQHDQS